MLVSAINKSEELQQIINAVLEMEKDLISRSYLDYDDIYLFMQ